MTQPITTPSGNQWHEILTQEEADLETREMMHAVYHYFAIVQSTGRDGVRFFSLRDGDGNRLSTCSTNGDVLDHAVCKRNGSPWPQYQADYEALVQELELQPLAMVEDYPYVAKPEPEASPARYSIP